jgi:crossover junction endodeoxyribonuclease RuvC
MTAILALDLALNTTGVAVYRSTRPSTVVDTWHCSFTGDARLRWFRTAIDSAATRVDLVVIEGYSYASKHQAHQVGEMGGVVRLALHDLGVPYVVLPPMVRAKLATGRGNAGKAEVLAAAIRRLGYDGHDDNEADALWLLEAALQHYGLSTVELPASHLAALAKVEWPELSAEAA